MGLIKRNNITEKGTIVLEKKARVITAPVPPVPAGPKPAEAGKMQAVQAKSEAEKIIDRALAEAAAIQTKAREEGRQEGKAEAAGRVEEAMETLNQAVKERKKIVKDAEAEILRLALKVAEQIIRSEVSLHRDVCLNIVAEAIARVSDREQIIVRVSREDAEFLKRYKDRLSGLLDGVKSFSILEDAAIEPGGCVIETNLGFIDSKISTKLKSIEEAFLKAAAEDNAD